jgi:hypothetical protein
MFSRIQSKLSVTPEFRRYGKFHRMRITAFPNQGNGRWVPALPYRPKPAWYGKLVSVASVSEFSSNAK